MILLLLTGLIMGGIGSLHCIGMCGPLALSVPVPAASYASKLLSALLYNIGRIVTYSCMGLSAGLIGASAGFFGFQQWLSLFLGAAILLYLIAPKLTLFSRGHDRFHSFLSKLRSFLASLFHQKKYSSVFFIGLLNGLLPCGLVYMAIATAISAGSVVESSLFMAAFGLGTLPLMCCMIFFGNCISLQWRINIRKLFPYVLFMMACLLIIRGLGFDIPYLSPAWHNNESILNKIECHPIQ